LCHEILAGRSETGLPNLCNATLIDSDSKRQVTKEMATFGSEFIAARIFVDHIIDSLDSWTKFCFLIAPVAKKDSYLEIARRQS
jgi:hypothetical protein